MITDDPFVKKINLKKELQERGINTYQLLKISGEAIPRHSRMVKKLKGEVTIDMKLLTKMLKAVSEETNKELTLDMIDYEIDRVRLK